MKIPAHTSQYLQAIEAVPPAAPVTLTKDGDNALDPLNRPIEQMPVDAAERTFGLALNSDDTVEVSEIARTSLDNIDKLRSKLDEQVRELFESQGIDISKQQEVDHSPAAVSKRIVEFSTNFYDIFLAQNPQLSEEQALDSFESTIRGAVDSGYGDAMDLLEGIGVPESVLDVSRETKGLVEERFDDFFAEKREALLAS